MSTKRIAEILWAISLFLLTDLATDAQAATYSFKSLDVPNAIFTLPISINASGQVVGDYVGVENLELEHGFFYSNGNFTTLDPPGVTDTIEVLDINDSGQVTGYYDAGSSTYGFVYDNGTFTILHVQGAIDTYAYSINDSGQVTGFYIDDMALHGFVYSDGTFTTLDVPNATVTYAYSINANGQVTGYYVDASAVQHGFVYSDGTFTTIDPPGATRTTPISINASGQVTGYYQDGSETVLHGFVYIDGTFTTLNVPNAISTTAYSINDSGQVTGWYLDGSKTHGFVYSDGTFTTIDPPGAIDTSAHSINDSGQVVGTYYDGLKSHGFIATPEPCDEVTIASLIVTPAELWPPNHKMVPVSVTVSAHDSCGVVPVCEIVSVRNNELSSSDYWVHTGNLTGNLRAEREGKGNGRVYTLTVRCANDADSAMGEVTVTVPHDQGKGGK